MEICLGSCPFLTFNSITLAPEQIQLTSFPYGNIFLKAIGSLGGAVVAYTQVKGNNIRQFLWRYQLKEKNEVTNPCTKNGYVNSTAVWRTMRKGEGENENGIFGNIISTQLPRNDKW